ncbi:MAG: HisA/HisF-related TIM barrel protein [Bacteroidia bacterium]
MELGKRIIPSLYTSDGQFAQTETRQHVLDYNEAMSRAIKFEAQGAEELIIMDVTTIAEKRRNLTRFLKDAVKTLKIPITFGGGIHSFSDVEDMLKLGITKIYVNSAAVRNPALINKITSTYGSGAMMVGVDTRKAFNAWKVYLNGGKSRTEIDLLNWIEMIQVRGAGEILVSTIARTPGDKDSVEDILRTVKSISKIPLLASVGAKTEEDFLETFQNTNVDGIVSGHFFLEEAHTFSSLKNSLKNSGIDFLTFKNEHLSEEGNLPQEEEEQDDY